MESSEIDLSEFQDNDASDGTGVNGDNVSGQDDIDANGATPQPASENRGLWRLIQNRHCLQLSENANNLCLLYCYYAETAAGSPSKQGKKLIISDEYFQRVTQALVMRLRQHEETLVQGGDLRA